MFRKKIKGVLQILRPELPFAAGVCVLLGEIIALGGFPCLREMTLGFMCGFFISGSAIVLNDIFDVEVDKAALEEMAAEKREVRKNIDEYVMPDGRRLYLLAEGAVS